ncbi:MULTISPECIES: hypothetical protein [unclassified Nocardioides]|uniref:hypothetical protein n=1 Tax=unclassified Nocardioides TaxID=2615069 RepID=UPI0030143613
MPSPTLSREDAASRVTAFVYGNVVALASLVPLTREDAETGRSAIIVLGAAVATFVAHAFAESAGRRVRSDERLTARQLVDEVRDSAPVLTAGAVCAVVLAAARAGGLPGHLAVLAAEGWVLLRLAATGPIVGAIRGTAVSMRTLLAGVGLALAGACVTGAKLALTH